MNHSRPMAVAVACALTLGLFGVQALADEAAKTDPPAQVVSPAPGQSAEPASSQPASHETSAQQAVIVDGPGYLPDVETPADPKGTVSFPNLEKLIREKNMNYEALEYTIEAMNDVDWDAAEAGAKLGIQGLEAQKQQLSALMSNTKAVLSELAKSDVDTTELVGSLTMYEQLLIPSLNAQIASAQASLDDIEDGVAQDQIAAATSQLRMAQDQIVMGGQTLYLSLLELEQTRQGLDRQLAALDRTIAQLEIRYEMGQISALTMAETRAGRTSLASGIQTLEMNMTNMRRQLEGMIGADITGTIQLLPIYTVTQAQIDDMDWGKDWKDLKRRSYSLDNAQSAVTDSDSHYAIHADNMTYKAALQSLELSFLALFDQIADQQQVLAAARTTLAVKEDALAAAQLKYEQGAISRHALLDARDARDEAQDKVDTAAIDLFTSYNNYCWAVDHGILN